MSDPAQPRPWTAVIPTLKRIDKSKINSRWLALRNAVAVAAPLSIGSLLENAAGAVAISTGALNVSFSDGRDPYRQRAYRMLLWSFLGAVAVFVGSATGKYHIGAILVTALWAFIGGMCLAISLRAGDLGLNTLVTVIVFSARAALSPLYALYAALLVLGGGLLQTGLGVLFWPLRRYDPERRAIASTYRTLADEIDPGINTPALAPQNLPPQQVQDVIAALGPENDLADARFRLLFDQADRIRISVFLLDRLRSELQDTKAITCVDDLRTATAKLVRAVADCLATKHSAASETDELRDVEQTAERSRQTCASDSPLGEELISAVNALVGQLRAVTRLAANVIPEGMESAANLEAKQPWRLQVAGRLAVLRANLDWRSPVFRHAVRLTACVALGEIISRSIGWQRSYWIPMTIAVVLKPDYSSTFSRGVLRLLGTLAGLALATVLYHIFPAGPFLECTLVFVFTFMLRYVGPANYGVFSVAVSGLIVFELAAAGTPPAQVVATRAINTAAGGILALIAYALWPTWERRKTADILADMVDAAREYFHAIVERFTREDAELEIEIDNKRREFRRTRSDAVGSVDRASTEPGISAEKIDALRSIMASSVALFASMLGLETGLQQDTTHTAPETFQKFSHDAEFTLYYLASSLRGSAAATSTLPKLRDDHARMVEARDTFSANDHFVLLETDRLTTALNTLREQIMKFLGS